MKKQIIKFSVLVFILFLSACKSEKSNTKEDSSIIQESLYLGQTPPGSIPELFAPYVVSINGRFESTISFSPDLKELYFDAHQEGEAFQIYFSKFVNGAWTPIKRANFTLRNKRQELHPFVGNDNKRLFFTALDSIFADEKIWYVTRLADSRSAAKMLDSPINEDLVFFANPAKSGGLYYFNISEFKTYYAPNVNGKFSDGREVEIEMGHHAFISPNSDYLLVTDRSNQEDNRRDIEPGLANIFWVSTEVIERLRPKE